MKDIHVRVEDELFDKTKAVYPYYGGMQQAVIEAIELWLKKNEGGCCETHD